MASVGCWLCYPLGLSHSKRVLQPGHVRQAIREYEKETGIKAGVVQLHPSMTGLAGEAPASVDVRYLGGCSMWSVWVADVVPVPAGVGE